MFSITGKFGNVDIMIDEIEETALQQLYHISSAPAAQNTKIVIMPDTHAGKGCVIGFTQLLNKANPRIVPNLLGVDISCTISAYKLGKNLNIDFQNFDNWIRNYIPLGGGAYLQNRYKELDVKYLKKDVLDVFNECSNLLNEDCDNIFKAQTSIVNQILSLGSGNHFIELGIDENDDYWLSVHCGSRYFGKVVCETYMKYAEVYANEINEDTEKDLCYLDKNSPYFDRYLKCVEGCHLFAQINHKMIADKIISDYFKMKFEDIEKIITYHNYLDQKEMIIRKGAISAYKDELVVIPFNMRDGLAICKGKGNINWNNSAPHGAGRIMSRGQAKRELDIEIVKADMEAHNIFTTSLDYALDEAADAYKDAEVIKNCIEPTVEILHLVKPLYNVKGK